MCKLVILLLSEGIVKVFRSCLFRYLSVDLVTFLLSEGPTFFFFPQKLVIILLIQG